MLFVCGVRFIDLCDVRKSTSAKSHVLLGHECRYRGVAVGVLDTKKPTRELYRHAVIGDYGIIRTSMGIAKKRSSPFCSILNDPTAPSCAGSASSAGIIFSFLAS